MARLEFTANGHQVVVEGVEPHQVSTVVGSLVATFDGIAEAAAVEQKRIVRDTYRIPSKSQYGKVHVVQHYGNGVFECDCPGFANRRYCSHTTEALDRHRKAYGYPR